jgi:hypothetical protein
VRREPICAAISWGPTWPIQNIDAGAVLNGTGRQTAHWVQVVAGGNQVWVLLGNTRAV